MKRSRAAFTLLEVALSIGILSFGLTAVVSVYMLSLKWAEEIRIDLTALQSGRIALFDAGVLMKKDFSPAGFTNNDSVAKGYVNDYFIVRSFDNEVNLPTGMGKYVDVHVKVYYGGNDEDGTLAHEIFAQQIVHADYNP